MRRLLLDYSNQRVAMPTRAMASVRAYAPDLALEQRGPRVTVHAGDLCEDVLEWLIQDRLFDPVKDSYVITDGR